jgi:hypothetical protein
MQARRVETDFQIHVEITLDGPDAPVIREGKFEYKVVEVRVTFRGGSRLEALADEHPGVKVEKGYRIKADGRLGAPMGRFFSMGWHNCEKSDYDAIITHARGAARWNTEV